MNKIEKEEKSKKKLKSSKYKTEFCLPENLINCLTEIIFNLDDFIREKKENINDNYVNEINTIKTNLIFFGGAISFSDFEYNHFSDIYKNAELYNFHPIWPIVKGMLLIIGKRIVILLQN